MWLGVKVTSKSHRLFFHRCTRAATPAVPLLHPCRVAASPDGEYLLVSWLKRPFSTSVPAGRFPVELQVSWLTPGSVHGVPHTSMLVPGTTQLPPVLCTHLCNFDNARLLIWACGTA